MVCLKQCGFFFFFSSRRRHTRYWRDWSSDVCSSDLHPVPARDRQVEVDPDVEHHPGGAQLLGVEHAEAIARVVQEAELRSGERRVGKECRSRWSPDHLKKNIETKNGKQ